MRESFSLSKVLLAKSHTQAALHMYTTESLIYDKPARENKETMKTYSQLRTNSS